MQQQTLNNMVEKLACDRFKLQYVNGLIDAWDDRKNPVEIKSCEKWIQAGAGKAKRPGRFRFMPGQLEFLKQHGGSVVFGVVSGAMVIFYRVPASSLSDQMMIARTVIEARFEGALNGGL
jgi:hypothetical protein